VTRFVIRRKDSTALCPTACSFSTNCLIGLSLMTKIVLELPRSGSSRIRPEVVSSVPPSSAS